ncbi:hypothetical protein D6817_04580 [Candidatus Pacearchaeota archaeon]|nr:MAG: hypothetical protein D6817_04580 [Candidatus Pacearchaeota archaeon]
MQAVVLNATGAQRLTRESRGLAFILRSSTTSAARAALSARRSLQTLAERLTSISRSWNALINLLFGLFCSLSEKMESGKEKYLKNMNPFNLH